MSQGFRQDQVEMAYLCSMMFGALAGEFKGWNHLKVCLLTYWQVLIIS